LLVFDRLVPERISMIPSSSAEQALHAAASQLVQDFIAGFPSAERLGLVEMFRALAAEPARVAQINARHYQALLALWSELLAAQPGPPAGAAVPDGDRRFQAPEWEALPFFRLLKRTYLLNARWLEDLLAAARLPPERERRLGFVLRQLSDALAPSNFMFTNPEALQLALQSAGRSLAAGLRHFEADLTRGRILMSDETAFEVGRNLAVTPGAVVHESPLAQLIQYAPLRERVYERPLLIVPPFINKYYILDLQPKNSLVRFALEQGVQVFIVSWRNIPAERGTATWDDYVRCGVLEPLEAVLHITHSSSASTLGFCVGGTLLATALATMSEPSRVNSLTLLATMLDYSDVGEIGVYVDEDYVRQCERDYADGGLMPGSRLATSFASLRANELVWRYVVNNYLKGLTPPAFDLLHWNADSANVPGRLYAWFVRNLYLENRLRKPGALQVCGVPVRLDQVRMPTYVMGARGDHIVPWRTAYASAQLLPGTIEFVLASSGHVAGVVSPPAESRRHYWVNPRRESDPDAWLAGAERVAGSWWTHWGQWLVSRSGHDIAAPSHLGGAPYGPIEPAPGRYVAERPM
jgi:polyhydroxyalkanoate synthase